MKLDRQFIAVLVIALCSAAFSYTAAGSAPNPQPSPCEKLPHGGASADPRQVCRLIEGGNLEGLSRPDFSDVRNDLRELYQPAYSLVWVTSDKPTSQATLVIDVLQNAAQKGLLPEDYDGPLWEDHLASLDQIHLDLALSISLIRYVNDLQYGRVSPQKFAFDLPLVDATAWKLAEFVRTRVIAGTDVRAALDEVDPPYPAYRRMLTALQHYLELAQQGDGPPLPPITKSVKPGGAYDGISQLAERLRLLGDLAPTTSVSAGTMYQRPLVEAVKHFQKRHGLTPDGVLGRDTLEELNVPLGRRVAQLQFALERLRWLSHDLRPPLILVNIPEFRLRAYAPGVPDLTMAVIVGKAFDHQTPVFQDTMQYLIFHPYWNVPQSITQDELIPEIEKDSGYLSKHDYEITTMGGQPIADGPPTKKILKQLDDGKLEIRQKPGPTNALGAIKFVFPNHYDVYLHGTPERYLFSRARRDLSHGCIRVQDPAALAKWVLRSDPSWTPQRLQATMDGTDTQQVKLRRSIPILIFYATASVEDSGEVHFFSDIYGHDAELQQALAGRFGSPVSEKTERSASYH